MLSQSKRLRAIEVRDVLARGKRSRAGSLSLRYVASREPLRIAVIASKSRARKATDRNRLRRAAYRAVATLPPTTGVAVVFIEAVPEGPLTPSYARDLQTLLIH